MFFEENRTKIISDVAFSLYMTEFNTRNNFFQQNGFVQQKKENNL
jgi:hypothetical protein